MSESGDSGGGVVALGNETNSRDTVLVQSNSNDDVNQKDESDHREVIQRTLEGEGKSKEALINGSVPMEVEESEKSTKSKVIIAWQCLNPECTVARKDELITANSYTLSYFGLEQQEGRKRKVCNSCAERVESGRAELVNVLRNQDQKVLSQPLPVPRDMVILEDSDEEPVTDSSEDSEFEVDLTSSSDSEGEGRTAEERLNSIIDDALNNLNMENQFNEATKCLTDRMASMKDDFEETDKLFKDLEAEVDGLRRELYSGHTATIKELASVDLADQEEAARGLRTGPQVVAKSTNSRSQFARAPVSKESAPPLTGSTEKSLLQQGQMAFAMRQNILQVWRKGSVEAVLPGREGGGELQYKLRFEGQCGGKRSVQSKVLSPRHLAYTQASKVGLKVGTRCIGLYREHDGQEGAFYSGIIAEPPKTINGNRYLVFFDDGYASYIAHENVREVCKASKNVWEDVHPNSREFIQQYLQQYPERPMVKLVLGQVVKTEWDGKWWISKVKQVDASLVKLVFDVDGRTEWIYRGSTRLGPLFMELEQQRMRKEQGVGFGRRQTLPSRRRDAPYVEYKRDEEASSNRVDGDGAPAVQGSRMVARKSTTTTKKTETQPVNRWENEGSTEPVDHPAAKGRKFRAHTCSPACLAAPEFKYDEAEHKQYNVLLIPILLGWERVLSKHRTGGRRRVFYVAPCGRRCRNLDEVHRYLRTTSSDLEIDFFNFDWWLHVRNEFKPAREFCTIKDLSYGKENVPVSCVNSIDRNYPEYVEYSTVRLPQKNVSINTSPEFMTCCDCTDDCINKEKCACWQMTIQGTAGDVDNKVDNNAGYSHRRLAEIVLTGIFECNSKCSCSKTCMNRVVQHPLRMKLQVFKTEKRGWGIRTLHDIPQGSFICVYVGNLFESEEANKQGQNFGDEYFAELDMIEVVERRKDGYESDVSDEGYDEDDEPSASLSAKKNNPASTSDNENNTEEELETEHSNSADDEDFTPSFHDLARVGGYGATPSDGQNRRKRGVSQLDGADDSEDSEGKDSDGLEVVKESVKNPESLTRRGGFSATVGISGPKAKKQQKERFVSTRKLYGKAEDVYIMDAKSIGNIGRYLNHSCNPNVFVQNVFVDTHDMRFPWIAFFASTFVRAGGELCWDYNYEVGSIPGKELYCSCGSEYCRGKLL